MPHLDDYAAKYEHLRMERRDGVLEVALHSNGSAFAFTGQAHEELPRAFRDIGDDPENSVVILTGTGDSFCATADYSTFGLEDLTTPKTWERICRDAEDLLLEFVGIPVPTIAAVNGPVRVHSELPVLCDIVLASEDAAFQDATHFVNGVVPGDGAHVVWPHVLGPNRGRYFLLTGQTLSAEEARGLGIVAEVLPRGELMTRARELAAEIAQRPPLTIRNTRRVLTLELERRLRADLPRGLALETLASLELQGKRMDNPAARPPD